MRDGGIEGMGTIEVRYNLKRQICHEENGRRIESNAH
jgi:hypothetical protein